jgi:hypothetical protein
MLLLCFIYNTKWYVFSKRPTGNIWKKERTKNNYSCFPLPLLKLLHINCTKGSIVIFPYMHIIYFDQIHLFSFFNCGKNISINYELFSVTFWKYSVKNSGSRIKSELNIWALTLANHLTFLCLSVLICKIEKKIFMTQNYGWLRSYM